VDETRWKKEKRVWNLSEKPVNKSSDVNRRRFGRKLKTGIGEDWKQCVKWKGARGVILVGKVQKADVCKIMWIWNGVQYSSDSCMLCHEQKSLKPTGKASCFCWLLTLTEDGSLRVTPTQLR